MNQKSNKTFSCNVNIKDNRIWLPKNIQKIIKTDFIRITIENSHFITKLTKDGRFVIPKKYRKNVSETSKIIKVNILRNLKRPMNNLSNNRIDVLSFVPEKTMSGFDILTLEKNKSLKLWYSTKGRPNELIINRFLPIEFILLIGYYQAEGGKAKLTKRRGREINFTNADLDIIIDFIKYLKYLINIDLLKCTLRYNKHIDYSTINKVKKKLISLGIKKENINDKQAERIKKYTIKIWVTNSVLGEIINNMMNKIRKYLSNKEANKKLIIYFLQSFIAGDGNFYSLRDNNGSLHSYLRLFESNKEFIEDYRKLLQKLGINGKIRKVKNKNLYLYEVFVNWNLLLKILKLGLLEKSPNNQKRLINAIKQHRSYKFGWLNRKENKELLDKVMSFKITR